MTFTPRAQKIALTAHIIASVSWIGAVAAFLVLSIAGIMSRDPVLIRSSYLTMNLIGWSVIVPLSIAALATGLLQGLGSHWGLVRYYWVLVKLTLTIGATFLLLLHQFTAVAEAARRVLIATSDSSLGVGAIGPQLICDSALALVALLVITTLSVFKPWGKTRYGMRKFEEQLARTTMDKIENSKQVLNPGSKAGASDPYGSKETPASSKMPRGLKFFIAITVALAATMAALHHISGHFKAHGH